MLAQLMRNEGSIVALDRTHSKVAAINSLASDLGITIINARLADSTQLCPPPSSSSSSGSTVDTGVSSSSSSSATSSSRLHADVDGDDDDDGDPSGMTGISSDSDSEGKIIGSLEPRSGASSSAGNGTPAATRGPPSISFEPESFDAVLLDAPCSALGLRPRLLHDWKLPQLARTAGLQRALMHSAVHMLKPGGVLVYCTCTINPGRAGGDFHSALLKLACGGKALHHTTPQGDTTGKRRNATERKRVAAQNASAML